MSHLKEILKGLAHLKFLIVIGENLNLNFCMISAMEMQMMEKGILKKRSCRQ